MSRGMRNPALTRIRTEKVGGQESDISGTFGLSVTLKNVSAGSMNIGLSIHDCLIGIEKRAERADDNKLTETFVDAAPLLASVSTTDHQVIFGRRGTGKTHILKYLHDLARTNGDISLYLDLRAVGSNGSIYNDRAKTHAQRATPLLLDVLQALHDALVAVAIDFAEEYDLSKVGPKLDDLAAAISTVEVIGPVERSSEQSSKEASQSGIEVGFSGNTTGPLLIAKLADSTKKASTNRELVTRRGQESYYVRFGSVQNELTAVLGLLGGIGCGCYSMSGAKSPSIFNLILLIYCAGALYRYHR